MDPEYSLQDVVRCHLCETPAPSLHCAICNIHLCTDCRRKHVLDESKEHTVVPFDKRKYTLKCQKHLLKQCILYCVQCDIPFCVLCVFSNEHHLHDTTDIMNGIEKKRNVLRKDLLELENLIYPKYEEIASDIPLHKVNLIENSQKLKTSIDKHGEDLHSEIDTITQKLKSDLDEFDSKHLADLNRQEDEIRRTISEITKSIAEIKIFLNSSDVTLVTAYKSKNTEFRRLPPKLKISLPNFSPKMIDKEQLNEQIGSLSGLIIRPEEQDYTLDSFGADSYNPYMQLINDPLITTVIKAKYGFSNMSCLSDQYIWARDDDSMMKLYNLQGVLVKSIQTKSGNMPHDISVTNNEDLVYTDYRDRTVNIVKNAQIVTVIRLLGWKPDHICSTSSGDLLVVMDSDDNNQTKVVRYSNFTEVQSIQYDDQGQRLYSSGYNSKYICENKNLDICVSDCDARAVIVVNQAGKLRFAYTGPPPTKILFSPRGITTDSQSRILTADINNQRIHILNQDGQLLRFIASVITPVGLCVDTKDNLYVAERDTSRVQKIKYCL